MTTISLAALLLSGCAMPQRTSQEPPRGDLMLNASKIVDVQAPAAEPTAKKGLGENLGEYAYRVSEARNKGIPKAAVLGLITATGPAGDLMRVTVDSVYSSKPMTSASTYVIARVACAEATGDQ